MKNDIPSMMNLAGEEILSSTVWNQSSAPGEHSPPAGILTSSAYFDSCINPVSHFHVYVDIERFR